LAILDVTPESVTERLSHRLRQMIGSGQPWSYRAVATRTGIDVRTLKAYVQGTACPSLVKYKRLLALLGPEVGTELNVMKGWLPRSDAVPPEAVNLVELRHELIRINGIIGEVLDENGIGHEPDEPGASPGVDDGGRHDDLVPGPSGAAFATPLKIEEIDARAVALRLSHRLRSMIGPNHGWQLGAVSDTTGIDRRTLQSYLDGSACPNLARFLRLTYLLGPEIGVELAQMIGWEPRFGAATQGCRAEIERLYESILATRSAIDRIIEHAPPGAAAPHLIRRGDRIQASSTIPLSVQR
jgi:hypothetical protein